MLNQQQQQQRDGGSSIGGERQTQLRCLLRAATGYAQQALSKADVAALFISRKILLAEVEVRNVQQWGQGANTTCL